MTTEAIFVVDDSADYRFLLQQVFARFLPGYAVRFFASGTDLYQHLLSQTDTALLVPPPQLILMDLNMPGLSGYETLLVVKKSAWRRVPVVIITSEGSEQERVSCYEAGANSFVIKPVGIEAMNATFTLICQYWVELNQA